MMYGYRGGGLLATALLLGVACGENVESVSRSHSDRGDQQLRLAPKGSTAEGAGAGPVEGAYRRMSAAVLAGPGQEDLSRQPVHPSPWQQQQQQQQQRRRTQTECEETSPLSITSSLSSDFEGCYFLSEVPSGEEADEVYTIYTRDGTPQVNQMWMFHGVEEINGVASPGKWWLAFVTDVDDNATLTGQFFCESGQTAATTPHPGDVTTWYCDNQLVSTAELSATCGGGCDGSTTSTGPEPEPSPVETPEPTDADRSVPTPVETPEPTEAEGSEQTEGSCEEDSPVSITSSYAPPLEGCYLPTELPFGDDSFSLAIYTPSGEPDVDQIWIHPGGIEGQEGTYWWLSFVTDGDDFSSGENYCVSGQSYEFHHPSDVTSWFCESLDIPTAGVSIACGCSDSPSADDDSGLSPTPQPAVDTSEPAPSDDPATPEPTEADSFEPVPLPTPQPTPAPESSGSRGLDFTPSPSAGSPDSADDAIGVPAFTPAPNGLSAGGGISSAAHRCASWSVFATGSASVAAAVALAVAW